MDLQEMMKDGCRHAILWFKYSGWLLCAYDCGVWAYGLIQRVVTVRGRELLESGQIKLRVMT
jgi:hypothetical protein